MSAEDILQRLDKVKPCKSKGPGHWVARCPAHKDRGPSLAIRELSDGRVLLHCFAGCETAEVLAAIDVQFDALFPANQREGKPERRPFSSEQALEVVVDAAIYVSVVAARLARGETLSDTTRKKLAQAAKRIAHVRAVYGWR